MVLYDLTNVSNSTNIVTYMVEVNNVSGGFLFNGLLGAFWVILFISFKQFETEDAMVASSFFCLLIAAFLRYNPTPMINDPSFYFWVAAFVLTGIVTFFSRQA